MRSLSCGSELPIKKASSLQPPTANRQSSLVGPTHISTFPNFQSSPYCDLRAISVISACVAPLQMVAPHGDGTPPLPCLIARAFLILPTFNRAATATYRNPDFIIAQPSSPTDFYNMFLAVVIRSSIIESLNPEALVRVGSDRLSRLVGGIFESELDTTTTTTRQLSYGSCAGVRDG